jgi:hypothetical protein
MSCSRNSEKVREICLVTHVKMNKRGGIYLICSCGCGLSFNLVTMKWRADHGACYVEGGKETVENLWPIMERCDAGKDGKAVKDTREIVYGKRAGKKHFGVRRTGSGFRQPPPGMKFDWKEGRYRRETDD